MATRIYLVTETATGKAHLVEASSQTQALLHITKPAYTVSNASPKDVAFAMAKGAVLEAAGKEQEGGQ